MVTKGQEMQKHKAMTAWETRDRLLDAGYDVPPEANRDSAIMWLLVTLAEELSQLKEQIKRKK
jgi:hypothetical protein